jgi:short-subunit dehydrogenase
MGELRRRTSQQPARRPFVALVTGASSGIGKATVVRLAREPHVSVVLVARREERLADLAAAIGERASWVAVDLVDPDAPAVVRSHVERSHGQLDLLVNNAGTAWRASFASGGYENVRRTMAINFDAPVRLTEALLPMLRASAPSGIVNVASVSGRVARDSMGAYCASKSALASWSDSLRAEEHAHHVHVGLVLPGFVETEGYPQTDLMARPLTRWIVSTPEKVAETIYRTAIERQRERYVPRPYRYGVVLRTCMPNLVCGILERGAVADSAIETAPETSVRTGE